MPSPTHLRLLARRPLTSLNATILLFALSLISCKRTTKVDEHVVGEGSSTAAAPLVAGPATENTSTRSEGAFGSVPADPLGYMKAVHSATLKEENTSAICADDLSSGFGWTQFFDAGKLVRSRVTFASARGHDVWEYHFYYRDGRPVVARQRVGDWRRTDQMATSDVVEERIFVFEGEEARQCIKSRVATPSDQKEQALERAERTAMPCEDAARQLAMAKAAQGPLGDVSWLKKQCDVQDPSADLLAEIRRDRSASEK
jgi:hypothetical protein